MRMRRCPAQKGELQHLDADVAAFDQGSRDATSNVALPMRVRRVRRGLLAQSLAAMGDGVAAAIGTWQEFGTS
jgi:hypothetical protein